MTLTLSGLDYRLYAAFHAAGRGIIVSCGPVLLRFGPGTQRRCLHNHGDLTRIVHSAHAEARIDGDEYWYKGKAVTEHRWQAKQSQVVSNRCRCIVKHRRV